MSKTRPLYLSMTYQDAADHGRLILRDGTSATIRLSTRDDRAAVLDFYRRLSPQSRRMRFFSESKPGEDVILSMCDSSNPARGMTLLVWRTMDGAPRVVATGSYIAQDPGTAEFAVAVDDAFHGKGLGGLILERLSALAVGHGFVRFNAFTHMNNRAMLDVFRHSGFELREQFQDGVIEVVMDVLPDEKSVSHALQRDRLFTKASIRPFFYPACVAVVGASRKELGAGKLILNALLKNGFEGIVYPVNPNAEAISGIKVLPSADDLPAGVDLAVIAVPRDEVEGVIDACARRGVKAVIVVSSGYAETGEEGRRRQNSLLEKVRGHGMRLLGPNCLGVINTDPEVSLNASLSPDFPYRGRVALSSQSGALGMALLNIARRRRIGLSMFISMGNKADVTGNDLLYFWEDDPSTDVILLYLESFGNPRRFGRIAREVSRRKPIVCVKSGRYRSAGEEHAVDALFHQTGVIRVRTLEEMFDMAALLGSQPLPAGRRVAIITNSRGAGVLCADAAAGSGLTTATLDTDAQDALRADLPRGASFDGIIDLTAEAGPGHYREAFRAARKSADTDAIIVVFTPIQPTPAEPILDVLCDELGAGADGHPAKPVITVMMSEGQTGSVIQHRGHHLPCYQFPEKAAYTLASAVRYREWRDAPAGYIPDYEDSDLEKARNTIQAAGAHDAEGWLTSEAARDVLQSVGLASAGESRGAAVPVEIGIAQDPVFGPVLSFSLAGYHRQVLNDIAYRMTPLTDADAESMVRSVRGFPLLGRESDLAALQETLLRLSYLVEEIPEIEQVSIAPVYVYRAGQGCACGAARIRVSLKSG